MTLWIVLTVIVVLVASFFILYLGMTAGRIDRLHRRIDVNEWHCYDATALTHCDARGLAFGAIQDAGGMLVASVAQESLWRI